MLPHDFWQEIHAPETFDLAGPHRDFYPATLPDGRQIRLPIRVLADGDHALASLIINQASFAVLDALAVSLAESLRPYSPDVVAAMPTLGLTLGAAVAQKLGHGRYVPLGTSRKFWYEECLSVPLSSITTPGQSKRLYVDPRMVPLLGGRRAVLIDDVISSGTSIIAGLTLLAQCDVEPAVLGFAMLQSDRWRGPLVAHGPRWPERIVGVMNSPMLVRAPNGGWHDISIEGRSDL